MVLAEDPLIGMVSEWAGVLEQVISAGAYRLNVIEPVGL
jgi:hypothetical protein